MTTFEERLREANLAPFKSVDLKSDMMKLLVKQL